MAATDEKVEAAASALEAAGKALAELRVAPIAAPKAFAVTDELVALAKQAGYEQFTADAAYRTALQAVADHLAKQAQEQPAGEWAKTPGVVWPTSSEPERVARPFELTGQERGALKALLAGEHLADTSKQKFVDAFTRAERTLGPTERERELERKLATEQQCNQGLSEMLTARDVELAQAKERENLLKEVLRAHSKQVSDAMERAECSENQLAHAKEREKALELRLSDAIGSAIDAAKACGDTDAELTQLRAKFAECEREPPNHPRLTPEREAWLRRKPAHYHVHELWPELDALRAKLAECERAMAPLIEAERRAIDAVLAAAKQHYTDLYQDGESSTSEAWNNLRIARASLNKRFPPSDPVLALIAKWRSHDAGSFNGGLHTAFANELEAALRAQKETQR